MSDHLEVEPEELRAHASKLRAVNERFEAIRSASGQISQADEAYGQLCQWLPPILEDRHVAQDELVDALTFNIDALADAVDDCADDYESNEDANAAQFETLADDM